MRAVLTFSILLVLIGGFAVAHRQGLEDAGCGFTRQGEPIQPVVAGPDEITRLIYVVEQPDSPIEIAAIDLEGTSVSSHREEYTEEYTVQPCAKYKVHNRSDRVVRAFDLTLLVSTGEGGSIDRAHGSSPLAPGQTSEIKSCLGASHSGTAQRNHAGLRLLVSVNSVDFGDCLYRPSLRIPRSLGIVPLW